MALNFWSLAATATYFLLATQTIATPLDETPVNHTARDVNVNAFYFYGWEGCNTNEHPDWSSDIMHAWDEVLDIGKTVTNDVDWSSDIAGDYLGSRNNNQDYQDEIQQILKNIQTWHHDGTILAWSIHARCDDYLRRTELSCPEGTKEEDEEKCNSRCWQAGYKKENGKNVLAGWTPRAAAYTTNHASTVVATINFCPSFFAMDTCATKIDKWGKTSDKNRLDMVNYQCRGYAALHELFHINDMAHRVADRVKHVYDRKYQIWSPYYKKLITVNAYGPHFTKTLANWSKNTGWWVVANADSLAQYALAMWVTGKVGDYPRYPIVSEKPRTDPADVNSATLDNNGQVTLTDNATILGAALGVDPSLAYDTFIAGDLSCSDGGDQGDSTDPKADPGPDPCVNNADNADIQLQASSKPETTSMPPIDPIATSAPVPNDFNCNCGESGCSKDSMPCCANGSCECHCTENGCAKDDPSCCANGTCKMARSLPRH